jgi:hypothetical protein
MSLDNEGNESKTNSTVGRCEHAPQLGRNVLRNLVLCLGIPIGRPLLCQVPTEASFKSQPKSQAKEP